MSPFRDPRLHADSDALARPWRVCLYGAGAIGGWLGARLAQSGPCQLSAVARGATLQALQTQGLRLQSGQAAAPNQATDASSPATIQVPVHASDRPQALGVQDLVVIAVKAPALQTVARHIAPLLGPDTTVLTAMNGVPWWFFQGFAGPFENTALASVDPGGHLAAAMASAHVVGCVVHASCSLAAPGHVLHHFGEGLILGEPRGQPGPRVQALAARCQQAGFAASVSTQIQRDIWYKLWGNMTVNPVSALTGASTDRILDDPLVREFMSRVMLEAREIGARIGLPIAQEPEDRHAVTRKLGAFKTSMLQDLEAQRPVELDALVSVVRELGQRTGVATPHTDALLGLARLQAQVRGLYP
jgi:2-dehydropantoate 2-reductase